MDILIDTNILISALNGSDPSQRAVTNRLKQLGVSGDRPCVFPQNLYEFWVVATRPRAVNGLEMSVAETRQRIEDLRRAYHVLAEPKDILDRWLNLCDQYGAKGRSAHDVRLIAAMHAYGMTSVLTRNENDFARIPGIQCIVP